MKIKDSELRIAWLVTFINVRCFRAGRSFYSVSFSSGFPASACFHINTAVHISFA